MAITPIDPLPTAPSRNDAPATFIIDADAWVAQINTWTTQANALAVEINAASVAAVNAEIAAVAAANYKGLWSNLTGALNIPASVSHNNIVWLLEVDLADVTASEPGITGDWLNISPNGIGKFTLFYPAASAVSRTTAGAADGSFETTTNKVMVVTKDFDAAVDEFIQYFIQMPESWNAGVITVQFVWRHAATTVNFDVAWAIEAVALANSDALDTAFGTAIVTTDTGGTTDDIFFSPDSANVTIANSPAKNDWVIFQISRDVSADAMAIDASLLGISITYTTDADTDD